MAYRPEYVSLEDEELIRLFQDAATRKDTATQHAVFTVLVERYQKRIYFAARKMVHGDHDEADEIAQDTFVKAYDALATFRGESKLYTWLYRITMNTVIQRSRRQKARQVVGLEEVANILESAELDPAGKMLQSETRQLIEAAIETLPPKQQRVFMMRFYDELPYEEIGEITGTSVGGLKANYFHAIRKIGEYLKASGRVSSELEAQLGATD
jgi:RNA polymerase sigma-70 factor (ECF subfamily)